MHKQPLFLALMAALSQAVEPARAEDAAESTALPEVVVKSAAEQEEFRAGTISSGSKFEADPRDVPQAVSVVNDQLIESQSSFSLRDALKNVAGLTVAAGEGGRTGDSITLRGFAANSDNYLDGVKDMGQYVRDTFFIEQVEVLKGPSSMLFGRGSTGGVINQISRKPRRADAPAFLETEASYGSFDFKRLSMDAGGPLTDGVQARVSAVMQDAGSFRNFNFTDRQGIAPSLAFDLGARTRLTLQGLLQEEDSVFDYGVPMYRGRPADVPVEQFYGYTDDRLQKYETRIGTAILSHKFSDSFSLRNTLRLGDYSRLYRTHLFGAVNETDPANPTVGRSQALRRGSQESLINTTDFQLKAPLGKLPNTLVFGVEAGREDFSYRASDSSGTSPISIFNPQLTPSVGAGRANDFAGAKGRDVETTTLGAYVMDQLEFVPGWKAVAGIRYDSFKAEQDDVSNDANDRSRTDRMWSPRLGLIWQPGDTQSYYLSYGESFNPSAEGYSLSATSQPLDPEENRNFEIGAKLDFLDGRLGLDTALFRLEKNKARTNTDDPTVQVLAGQQHTNGFELELTGRPTTRWNLRLAYAFLDARVDESNNTAVGSVSDVSQPLEGKVPVNVPKHSGALWSVFQATPHWSLGGGVFFASSRYTDSVNEVKLPGYARWDAVLSYTQPRWALQLNAYNLFDTVYYESGQVRSALPGTPRSVLGTLRLAF